MSTSRQLRGYASAVLLCVIAVPIALRFDVPSSAFLLAAMATCLFWGRKPAMLAIVLLAFSFDFFFLTPKFDLRIASGSLIRFLTFVGTMILATELINAKRRSDLARLQREKDFRSLAETCPDCILMVDENQVIQFANPATIKMFGYSTDEVRGKTSSLLIPDLKKDEVPAGEFLAFRKQGDRLDVEAICGRFDKKTTIFLRDISERKRAQGELEKSEDNLRLTLDTIPGLVYSRSPDGTIEYMNRHATEYFGKTLEELRNGAWIAALHPDEKESVLGAIRRSFATGQAYTMEYRQKRFDGTYRWFQAAVQPLRGTDGHVVRWYGLLTDIDDRRRMEDSLRQTEAKLSQAAQIATAAELSASIVHEISQPIAAMVANGQACLRWLSANPPNVSNGTTAVERIVRDGKDATEIIKGLRTLFKRSSPQKIALNLREVVDEVVFLTRSRMVRESVILEVVVPGDLPQVLGDRIQLQQVLLNLVSNAIEAMYSNIDRPKKLIILSRENEKAVLTQVIDSGEGISDMGRVFDAFFTTKENGMGMGLPICKSIVESHGGRLWASNGVPTGSIISFTIPHSE